MGSVSERDFFLAPAWSQEQKDGKGAGSLQLFGLQHRLRNGYFVRSESVINSHTRNWKSVELGKNTDNADFTAKARM